MFFTNSHAISLLTWYVPRPYGKESPEAKALAQVRTDDGHLPIIANYMWDLCGASAAGDYMKIIQTIGNNRDNITAVAMQLAGSDQQAA